MAIDDSLAVQLPKELSRVREIRDEYLSIGPPGMLAAEGMRHVIERAERAMAAGDIVEMLRVYQTLKEYEL